MARGAKLTTAKAGPVEGPWKLPDGWRWERLGDVADILDFARRPVKASERSARTAGKALHELVPYYGATGQAGWIDAPLLEGSYVLLGEDGAPFLDPLARKAYAVEGRIWVNNHAHILKGGAELDDRYLLHALNAVDYRPWVNGTTRLKLTQAAMRDILLPLPNVETQRRITGLIDNLFDEIDDGEHALRAVGDDLETYAKALLKAAFDGALTAEWRSSNPPDQTGSALLQSLLDARRSRWAAALENRGRKYVDPQGPELAGLPDLPQGWCWASLQQIAFVSGGVAVDAKRKPVDPVDVPYLRVANVQRGRLDLSVLKTIAMSPLELAKYRLEPGDILLNEGGDRDKVGRGWVWDGAVDPCVHQNHVFKARPASDLVEPELVSSYLNELGRRFFIDESKQTTNLASISLTKVSRAPIPIPPIAEARAIRLALAEAGQGARTAASVRALRATSSGLRQSILAAAFRGDLVA